MLASSGEQHTLHWQKPPAVGKKKKGWGQLLQTGSCVGASHAEQAGEGTAAALGHFGGARVAETPPPAPPAQDPGRLQRAQQELK